MGKHSAPDFYPMSVPGLGGLSTGPTFSPHWTSGDTGGAEGFVRPDTTTAPMSTYTGKHRPRTQRAITKSYKANDPDTPTGKKKLNYVGKHSSQGLAARNAPLPTPAMPTFTPVTPRSVNTRLANANASTPSGTAFNSPPASPPVSPRQFGGANRPAGPKKTPARSRRTSTLKALAVIKATHEGSNKRVLEKMVNK